MNSVLKQILEIYALMVDMTFVHKCTTRIYLRRLRLSFLRCVLSTFRSCANFNVIYTDLYRPRPAPHGTRFCPGEHTGTRVWPC